MARGRCSSCDVAAPRPGQRYCVDCHNAHARNNRPQHSALPPESKRKANARAYANVYVKRGALMPQPCERCGAQDAEKHHPNYESPLCVHWLCRACHLATHNAVKHA